MTGTGIIKEMCIRDRLGFGHLLAKGVRTALAEEGAVGILTGGLTAAAAGITTSLVCGVVCSWAGKSHDQN